MMKRQIRMQNQFCWYSGVVFGMLSAFVFMAIAVFIEDFGEKGPPWLVIAIMILLFIFTQAIQMKYDDLKKVLTKTK